MKQLNCYTEILFLAKLAAKSTRVAFTSKAYDRIVRELHDGDLAKIAYSMAAKVWDAQPEDKKMKKGAAMKHKKKE